MNGVWHSEQFISKSGIAVSPRERTEDIHSLLLFGALAWRFFQPQGCGAKALFLKHYAEKLASRLVIGPEFTPLNQCIQTIFRQKTVARSLHRPSRLLRCCHTELRILLQITRHECCSSFRRTW